MLCPRRRDAREDLQARTGRFPPGEDERTVREDGENPRCSILSDVLDSSCLRFSFWLWALAGRARTSKLVRSPRPRRRSTPASPVAAATAVATPPAVGEPRAPVKPARSLRRAECEPFRRLLLEKRAQLAGDVNTLQNEALSRNRQDASGDLSNMPIHMADLGTDNYEQEFTLGLIESERKVLQEIDEALERIKCGTYGVCVATGGPIGKARLKAKPWAKYCYEYTLAQERGQKGSF